LSAFTPPLPTKNQWTYVAVVDNVGITGSNGSSRVESVIGGDVHAGGARVPKNHGVGLIAATEGDPNTGLGVERAQVVDAGIGGAAIVADAPPFK
jgi:polyribonucleotide nucleotidyltransferase